MAKKIDDIEYPDNLDDILTDDRTARLFRKFLDKSMSPEIYKFWDVVQKKPDPKTQYKVFFAKNAKLGINVGSKILADARRLGEAKDWTSKDWKDIYVDADADIYKRLAGGLIGNFYSQSVDFKKLHALALEKVMFRKVPKQLLTDLNSTDKKAVANVAALLKADKRAGAKAVKDFSNKKKGVPALKETRALFKKYLKI